MIKYSTILGTDYFYKILVFKNKRVLCEVYKIIGNKKILISKNFYDQIKDIKEGNNDLSKKLVSYINNEDVHNIYTTLCEF